MALQPFAKAADLTLLAGVDEATADLVLSVVSGAIRASLGWDVDKVVGATHTVTVDPGRTVSKVVVPALNVTVTQVTVDGTVLTAADYVAKPSGVVTLRYPADASVAVQYTGGWAATPTDQRPSILRLCALEYATRLAGNPAGARSYAMGGTSETFGSAALSMATDDERLDALRVTS